MKSGKAIKTSLMVILFCVASNGFAATKNIKNIGYTDHITINLNSYEVGFKELKVFNSGITTHFKGCIDGQKCMLTVTGFSGDSAITLGSDFAHSCQFFISDGAFQTASFYQNPNCSGQRGANQNLSQDSRYKYHTQMW